MINTFIQFWDQQKTHSSKWRTGCFRIVETKQRLSDGETSRRCEDLDEDRQWIYQAGVPLHTANITMAWLREKFRERLISRRVEVEWPPHSPKMDPTRFLPLMVPQGRHPPGQPSHLH